jgi:hypothetical protein
MNDSLESFGDLLGKTLIHVETNADNTEMYFVLANGIRYALYHDQDCCELVSIEDIIGNLDDLIGQPILMAEEASEESSKECVDSSTWTFYKLATIKGYVTIRWYGSSNGYYSEGVSWKLCR